MDPERLGLEARLAALELLVAQLLAHKALETADPLAEVERHRENMREKFDDAIRAKLEPADVPVVLEALADAVDRLLAEALAILRKRLK